MRFILRRLGFYVVAFWAAITVNFLLPRLIPGNPIDYFMLRYQNQLAANPHLLDSLRPAFDFKHQSLLDQYAYDRRAQLLSDILARRRAEPAREAAIFD